MHPRVRTALDHGVAGSRDIHTLYKEWWSGATLDDEVEDRVATKPRYYAPSRWLLEEVSDEGLALASRNGQTAVLARGEWTIHDRYTVSVSRRRSWSRGPWSWRISPRPAENEPSWALVRIYLPGTADSLVRFEQLGDVLDSMNIWFEAKAWLPTTGARRDHTVIWISGSVVEKVVTRLGSLVPTTDGPGPPPLTLPLFDGRLGLSANPPDGTSRGLAACGAVVSLGDAPGADLLSAWAAIAPVYGIDPEAPWRNAGMPDPYGIWKRVEATADA